MTLVEELRALGLNSGDAVVVHSSLRLVAAGPGDVATALLRAVGREGLLVVPTFTYTTERYDAAETPGRTGSLAETVRRRPDAVRSLHPTHSVAAVGPGGAGLVAGHELLDGTDVDTPLHRLARRCGWVLLLGVSHVSNTTVHVGEFVARAPYLDIPFRPEWPRVHEVAGTGRFEYARFPGCSRAFGAIERGLRSRGAIRDGRVGGAEAQLVRGDAVIAETAELLGRDPAALLCTAPSCYRCSTARRRLSAAGPRARAAAADPAR